MNRMAHVHMAWMFFGVLGLIFAGSGCARFRKSAAGHKPGGDDVPDANQAAAAPAFRPGAGRQNGNGRTNGTNRLVVDTNHVLSLQTQVIEGARQNENGVVAPANHRFTRWLDRTHDSLYRRLDNAVRRVDTMWLTEEVQPYDYDLSTFRLRFLGRVGGRSLDGNGDFKVRFRADLALPGLQQKLHLFLDNSGRDELPGSDPLDREDDTRLGIRTLWKTLRHHELSLGGGVRFHSARPVAWADVEWKGKWPVLDGKLELNPRGFWYDNEDQFGQRTTLTWTRPLDDRKWFQWVTSERTTEATDGLELEQTIRFASLRIRKGRGWVVQASMFPHYKHSEWKLDDFLVNLTLRRPLYRNWVFYTLTPQVEFPREDDYHPKPSLRIGMEILLGGELRDLL